MLLNIHRVKKVLIYVTTTFWSVQFHTAHSNKTDVKGEPNAQNRQ
jgi:hypothetical protein